MCYRAEAFIRPEAATDRDQLRELGWLGVDASAPIARIDPHEGPGIDVYQHPSVLVARDPELHRIVDEFSTGIRRKPRRGDSHWDVVALLAMNEAHAREMMRRTTHREEDA